MGRSNKNFVIAVVLLTCAALPAAGQIISVHPTPPPCTGAHCLKQIPGASVPHHGAASAQRAACPLGTVYDSRKGTCRVISN